MGFFRHVVLLWYLLWRRFIWLPNWAFRVCWRLPSKSTGGKVQVCRQYPSGGNLAKKLEQCFKTKRKPGRKSWVQPAELGKKVPLVTVLTEYNCRLYRFEKKTKVEGSQKLFFGHYCEKSCWFTNRRDAKKQLLSKLGQNLAGKAVFELEQKRWKTAYKDFVAKLEFSHQKKMKKFPPSVLPPETVLVSQKALYLTCCPQSGLPSKVLSSYYKPL